MDWMWTDTTLALTSWLQMEDIYANIFLIKCYRRAEEVCLVFVLLFFLSFLSFPFLSYICILVFPFLGVFACVAFLRFLFLCFLAYISILVFPFLGFFACVAFLRFICVCFLLYVSFEEYKEVCLKLKLIFIGPLVSFTNSTRDGMSILPFLFLCFLFSHSMIYHSGCI